MVEVELTVGKLDASLALLLTKDHHLVEFPTVLLPDGIVPGSIVRLQCERDIEAEERSKAEFTQLQEEIYNAFGKYEPADPVLRVLNVTQTCCVLEWDNLNLGTSELKSLSLYKNGSRMASIKSPLGKRTIKFSGLPIDTPYKFQLKMETSCGAYWSNMVEIRTHKMTDLTGITCCLGDIDYSVEKFTRQDIEDIVEAIGANRISESVRVDTTQFVCTKDSGIQYQAALEANVPIVRPEWLKACQLERRIVGVSKFYLNAESPLWKERDFWAMEVESPEAGAGADAEVEAQAEAQTDAGADAEADAETGVETTADAQADVQTGVEAEADAETAAEAAVDAEIAADTQTESEAAVDVQADADAETAADAQTETQTEAAPETQTDADADAQAQSHTVSDTVEMPADVEAPEVEVGAAVDVAQKEADLDVVQNAETDAAVESAEEVAKTPECEGEPAAEPAGEPVAQPAADGASQQTTPSGSKKKTKRKGKK